MSAEGKRDKFFKFPLSVIASPYDPFPIAICSSMRAIATKKYTDVSVEDLDRVDRWSDENPKCSDADEYPALVLAAQDLGVALTGSIADRIELLDEFEEWVTRQERSKATAWIRKDLFWDAHAKNMPMRRFAILCGIYARIGPKSYAKISAQDLQRLAAGLGSRNEMERHQSGELEAGEIFSADKIRGTVNRLVADSLATRYTYNRGETYYAHPARHSTTSELEAAVLRSKAKRQGMERELVGGASTGELRAFLEAKKKSQRR